MSAGERRASWVMMCGLMSVIAGCGGESAGEDAMEIGVHQQPVINGTNVKFQSSNPGVVALYHVARCEVGLPCSSPGSYFWYPRPCSATILRTWKTETWILTARHCVTENGDPGGPLIPAAGVRINTSLAPGVINDIPPAGSLQADQIVAPVVTAGMSGDRLVGFDYALVHVPQVMTAPGIKPTLSLQPDDDLSPKQAFGYGYGRNVETGDPHVEDGSSGAGRLRYGRYFRIDGECDVGPLLCGSAGWYRYTNLTSTNQSLWRGDSGGPTFIARQDSPLVFEQVGIHSSSSIGGDGFDCQTSGLADFIQSKIGYLHVSPHSNMGLNLTVQNRTVSDGALVQLDAGGTSPLAGRWVWDSVGKKIYTRDAAGTRYYLVGSSFGSPTFGAVSIRRDPAPYYATWELDEARLVMSGDACLELKPDNSLKVSNCGVGVSQRWAWHAQP